MPDPAPDPSSDAAAAPPLSFFARIECDVAAVVSLGAAPFGERRYVPIEGGRVGGPDLVGRVRPGGVDWQWLGADGALEIAAHYVIEAVDGALIEVQSRGVRHAAPPTMQRLARGETVARDEMYFRTQLRLCTGAPRWRHLNRQLFVACGAREGRRVLLDCYRVG